MKNYRALLHKGPSSTHTPHPPASFLEESEISSDLNMEDEFDPDLALFFEEEVEVMADAPPLTGPQCLNLPVTI